ncbi:hypothetical protein HYW17_01090 [Candidatus Uhrbacteria bacterium]|nr:hypothetical protein [Candidatus Uhrbacteria bacterium]
MFINKSSARFSGFLSRYHFVLAIIFVILLCAALGAFLYQNFFLALQETKTLAELKEQAVLEPLKLNLFTKAMRWLEIKKSGAVLKLNGIRDPFAVNPDSALPE